MGGKFWLSLLGGLLLVALAVVIAMLAFGAVWYTWGLGGAILLVFAILLVIGWIYDRREKRRHEGLA
jgi:uncharacterized membrane protein